MKPSLKLLIKSLIIPFLLLLIVSCNNSYVDNIERGAGYDYRPGFPELRVVASSFIDPNQNTFLDLSSELVYGSLIYLKRDSLFTANGTIEYQIQDLENPGNIIDVFEDEINISYARNSLVYSQETHKIEKRIPIPPSTYQINTSFTDDNTGKTTTRSSEVKVPNPKKEELNITSVDLYIKETGSKVYRASTTYDVQSSHDSLKFEFQITNGLQNSELEIRTRLMKFDSDTNSARPMNYNDYNPSSIQYQGIQYSDFEEINTNRRIITTQGSISIEFAFAALETGNYRFEVTTITRNTLEEEIYKAREFSVKSPNYPTLRNAYELAQPLVYLMTKKEHEELMASKDEKELKRKIDKFWLSNVKNSQKAKYVIELFYQRVEDANKQFSNFKEGWKTDRGMLYILFGPPWYIDNEVQRQIWSYSYNSQDFEKNFLLVAPRLNTKFYPFENYLLQRSSGYSNVYYQQIELWKSGLILDREL